MFLNYIKKKLDNRRKRKWALKNKLTLKELMRFDIRFDQFPEELQKTRKLGFLIRNKKWLTEGQYKRWYDYLTTFHHEEEKPTSDIQLY